MSDTKNNDLNASVEAAIDYDTLAHIDAITDAVGNSTGPILNDGYTDDLQPTLSGRLPMGDGQVLRVYANGIVLGYADIGEGGYWNFKPVTPLEVGKTYNFQVFLLDSGTTELLPSNTFTITTTELNQDITLTAPTITDYQDNVGDYQGDFKSGTTTDDATPELKGHAQANSIVRIYEGSTLLGSVVTKADGSWSYTTPERSDGEHTFTATATDAAGNISDKSGSFVITIDTHTEMAITGLQDNAGTVTGLVTDGGITDDTRPVLIGTAEPGSIVYISSTGVYGEHYSFTVTAGSDGKWALPQGYGEGNYGTFSYSAYSVDAAGNHSETATFQVKFVPANQDDTTTPDAPTITGYHDNVGDYQGDFKSGTTTDDTTPELKGHAQANSIVRIYEGSTLLGSVVTKADGSWSYTTPERSDGEHTFTATVTDAAGNVSGHSGNFVITIDIPDSTPALIEHVTDNVGPQTGDIKNGGTTDDRQPHIAGSAEAGSTVTIHQYDPFTNREYALGSVVADSKGHWEYQMTGGQTLQEGVSRFWVTTLDNTGNAATSPDFVVTFDNTAPAQPTIDSFLDNAGHSISNGSTTNDDTPTLQGHAEANAVVKVYEGSTLLGSTIAHSDGTWSYTTPVRADGKHDFTVTATDAAGNVSVHSDDFVANVLTAAASGSEDFDTVGNDIFGTNEIVHLSSGLKITAEGATKNTSAPTRFEEHHFDVGIGNVARLDFGGVTNHVHLSAGTIGTGAKIEYYDSEGRLLEVQHLRATGATSPTTPVPTSDYSYTAPAGENISYVLIHAGYIVVVKEIDWGNQSHVSSLQSAMLAGPDVPDLHDIVAVTHHDTTPPVAPVINAVYDDQGVNQGSVANGGKTDDKLLKITGTAEHDSIVLISHVIEGKGTVYIDGSVVADASGHWVFQMTAPFQPTFGNRIITATATDAAGNTSAASDSYVVN
ncbi:Ig-like domain-containing protein, partial [Rahnella ecdela]